MNETSQVLMRHGLPLVFAAVFVEQMGLPIPAVPLLLTVGALSATGKFSLLMGIPVTMIARRVRGWHPLQVGIEVKSRKSPRWTEREK